MEDDEWKVLSRICPENDRKFTMRVDEIGDKCGRPFQKKSVLSHFAAYNIFHDVRNKGDGVLVSFPSFFCAFRAWKEKHRSLMLGRRISVLPLCGNAAALATQVFTVKVLLFIRLL